MQIIIATYLLNAFFHFSGTLCPSSSTVAATDPISVSSPLPASSTDTTIFTTSRWKGKTFHIPSRQTTTPTSSFLNSTISDINTPTPTSNIRNEIRERIIQETMGGFRELVRQSGFTNVALIAYGLVCSIIVVTACVMRCSAVKKLKKEKRNSSKFLYRQPTLQTPLNGVGLAPCVVNNATYEEINEASPPFPPPPPMPNCETYENVPLQNLGIGEVSSEEDVWCSSVCGSDLKKKRR